MAASVVDLPDPVGPVTSTRPRGFSHRVRTIGRQAQRVESLDFPGNRPEDRGDGAALVKDVAAEARQALQTEGKVQLEVFFQAVLLHVGKHAIGKRLRIRRRERRHVQRTQLAVDAHARRAVGRKVQVAAPQFDHFFQKFA